MEKILSSRPFIGGQFVDGLSHESLDILDKYSGDLITNVDFCNKQQIDQTLSICDQAFEKYKKFSMADRAEILKEIAVKLEKFQETFAELICVEAGKPIDYARIEVKRSIENLKIASRHAYYNFEETVNFPDQSGLTGHVKKFPIGTVLGISPYNFPLNLALHKIAPALVVGNPIIIKPSPYAPLTMLSFCTLVENLGIPEGMINVVMCDNDVAQYMVSHEKIKLLSFTGSAEIGWKLKSLANKKKVVLELGGNAACVVDKDVDISSVATKVCNGSFLYSGQVCISTQRVYVHDEIYEEFVEELVKNTEKLNCGNPEMEGVVVGPLIDEEHLDRIRDWVVKAVSDGAEVLTGGYIIDEEKNLYAPTVLTNTSPDMEVWQEEAFGPVICIEKSDSFSDALELVNDSRYGLQAGVFTDNIAKMKEAFESLDVGAVIINNVPGFRADHMPYGGIKDSGLGREGILDSIEHMSEKKLLVY